MKRKFDSILGAALVTLWVRTGAQVHRGNALDGGAAVSEMGDAVATGLANATRRRISFSRRGSRAAMAGCSRKAIAPTWASA